MPGRFNIPPPPQEKGPSEWWPALAMLAAALGFAALLLALAWAGCAAMAGVPAVAGDPSASATSALREAGYTPREKEVPSETVPEGHVIETVVPEGGTESDVVVIVSSGPAKSPPATQNSPGAKPAQDSPARPAPDPQPESNGAAAGDEAVVSDIRDQRDRVAAVEGALVAPDAAADPGATSDARAVLEDIAGQAPEAGASPCATAAQKRWLASLNSALERDLTPEAARALTAAADKAAAEVQACSPDSPVSTTEAQAVPVAAAGELCAPQAAEAAQNAVVEFGSRHGERARFPYLVPCAVADVQPRIESLDDQVRTTWHWGACAEACGDVIFTVAIDRSAQTCADPSQTATRVRLLAKRMWHCHDGEDLDSYNVDGSGNLTYSVQATSIGEAQALPGMLGSVDLSAVDWGMPLPSARPSAGAPRRADPPGSGPQVAFAFTTEWGESGARLADSNGKVLGVARGRVGYLVYDKSGVLWLTDGGWDNSGQPSSACDVRRFGDSAPLFSGADVLEELIRAGRVPADTSGNNLLCGPLSPSPQGGAQDVWEDLIIRMPRRGGDVIVTPAPPERATADDADLWNGQTVAYTRNADGDVVSSVVPGVGRVPGEVTFVSPTGQMLVANRGEMENPDEISLIEPDGSSRVIWPRSLGKKIAVHREQGQTTAISRDGKWVFVMSGTYPCMSCSGDVYRVDLARGGAPKKVASKVVTLGVPPLPAQRADG